MNFDQALAYLLSLGHETLTIKLGLRNTEVLLAALGNPHRDFPAVQIAGTNGKGSTAVMLDSISRAAGIRTGRFTSPHLISITERIRIGGQEISNEEFARLTTVVRDTALELFEQHELETLPTFFEHVTAIALLAFREAKVDLAILETGLGGRLDSTTAVGAPIVAITQVAMDHEEYLGHTIAEIAAEKAAIIHPGATAIIGPQTDEPLDVILRRCTEMDVSPRLIHKAGESPLTAIADRENAQYRSRLDQCTADGRCRATIETPHAVYEEVLLGLRGRHQSDNAAVAVALAESLSEQGFNISREAVVRGLERATHRGRLELWDSQPQILFDGAHNPASAAALQNYLDEFFTQPITMIFGAMRDKRLAEMAGILFPRAKRVILTALDNPRAASVEELAAAIPNEVDASRVHQAKSTQAALRLAYELAAIDDLIVVTGSLYLVGEAQAAIRK